MSCQRGTAEFVGEVEALANGLKAAREGPDTEQDGWLRDLEAEARGLAARMRAALPAREGPSRDLAAAIAAEEQLP